MCYRQREGDPRKSPWDPLSVDSVGVCQAVGEVGASADPHGRCGALEVIVVGAVGALAGSDSGHDRVEAALDAERDEGHALGIRACATDGDCAGVAVGVLVVAAAGHGALGDLRQFGDGGHVVSVQELDVCVLRIGSDSRWEKQGQAGLRPD